MTPQEMIDVIQAHTHGKQIEFLHKTENPLLKNCWIDCKNSNLEFYII
jgi:hypothetical protein